MTQPRRALLTEQDSQIVKVLLQQFTKVDFLEVPWSLAFLINVTVILRSQVMCCCVIVLCRRAHRLTVLIIFVVVLVYEALWEGVTRDSDYNTKRLVFSTFAIRIYNNID